MRFRWSFLLVLSVAAAPLSAQKAGHRGTSASTTLCEDGTRSAVSGRAACTGHGGVHHASHVAHGARHAAASRKKVVQQGTARAETHAPRHARPAPKQQPNAHPKKLSATHPEHASRARAKHASKPHEQHASKPHPKRAAKPHGKDASKAHADHRAGLRAATPAKSQIRIARDGNPAPCNTKSGSTPASSRACASRTAVAASAKH